MRSSDGYIETPFKLHQNRYSPPSLGSSVINTGHKNIIDAEENDAVQLTSHEVNMLP